LAHRSKDLEERVDTRSTMAVTEGDLFCDKEMTPNKNLRVANPKKRGIRECGYLWESLSYPTYYRGCLNNRPCNYFADTSAVV